MKMKRDKILMVGIVFFVILNIFNTFSFSNIIYNAGNPKGFDSPSKYPNKAEMVNRELVNDTGFSYNQDYWNMSVSPVDPSDITANISGSGVTGEANYIIQGNTRNITISENNPSASDWKAMVNPEFNVWPQDKSTGLPNYFVDATGWSASHSWAENVNGANGSAGILYKRNYTLPLNLSDYVITSFSADASFNASIDPGTGQSGIEVPGEGQFGAIYDFARVYLEISNLKATSVYRLLFNTTGLLGKDSLPPMINNTHLDLSYPNDILIAYLSNVLSSGDYQNLTIILGIDFHCEKNSATDVDTWYQVIINDFTMSFTVEKRINQQAAAAWYQDDTYLPNNIIMLDAKLTFDYKVNMLWPNSSLNSEFRIWIGSSMVGETVPLSEAGLSYKQAEIRIDQLHEDMVVNLSIQVYIGDNFLYDRNLTVTIDNVHLNATWNTTTPLLATKPLKLLLNGTDRSSDPAITVPEGFFVNVTVIYTDDVDVFLPDATVSLSTARFSTNINKDIDHDQYTYLINVSEQLYPGINYLSITAFQDGYKTQEQKPTASITLRNVQTNITSATGSNIINIAPESDAFLNITLMDLDRNETIKQAQVYYTSDIDSGALIDSNDDGSYEGWISNVPAGSYQVKITATSSGPYDWTDYEITLNADNALLNQTIYVLLINGTDYTLAPVCTVPILTMVNITVKYTDISLGYISDANVELTRLGYIDGFSSDEPDGQYTLLLNSSQDLLRGTNNLFLKARKSGYTSNSSNLQITVRKYDTQISLATETGPNRVDIKPGETVTIQIRILNTDIGTNIKGMSVSYKWQFGEGSLTDDNHDGIYEATFENVPEGSYPVLITVYSDENYSFESYDLTIAASRTPEEIFATQMILIVAIVGAICFGAYIAMYQLRWKYPPFVRTIRQVRRSVKKGRGVKSSINIPSRTELIDGLIQKDLDILGIKRKTYLTPAELPATRKIEKSKEKPTPPKTTESPKPAVKTQPAKSEMTGKTEKEKLKKEKKPESKQAEVKPAEKKQADKSKTEPAKKPEVKPAEVKPIVKLVPEPAKKPEAKPAEVKPIVKLVPEQVKKPEVKPVEVKPAEAKPEVKPEEKSSTESSTNNHTDAKDQPASSSGQPTNAQTDAKENKLDAEKTTEGK